MRITGIRLDGIKVSDSTLRGTLENPGISAQDIYDSGQTASDWYYIQTSTMPSPLQVYCNMTNESGDWIYMASSWWTVCGPGAELQAQGRSGNAQGTGSWTNTAANALYGMANVAATTNSVRSDINSYAVYIK